VSTLRATPSNWSNPSVSPDGRLLAIDISDGTQTDVWIYDWQRDTLSRRTFHNADDVRPVWSPDGTRIAFASRRDNPAAFNIYWQRADGTGEAERLTTSKNSQWATSFHPNGRLLAFTENTSAGPADVMMLPIEGDEKSGWKPGTPTAFLKAPYAESSPMFSPDGRWVAYLSGEGGRTEIFVQPYPGPGGKYQISAAAADDPTWSRTAPEFFFVSAADLRIMVMPYRVEGNTFNAGKPVALHDTRIAVRPRPPSRDLDLHPDGKRFVVAGAEDEAGQKLDKVVFVFNFFDELRRIAPSKGRD
jgi:serine/threonine-protein kinase